MRSGDSVGALVLDAPILLLLTPHVGWRLYEGCTTAGRRASGPGRA